MLNVTSVKCFWSTVMFSFLFFLSVLTFAGRRFWSQNLVFISCSLIFTTHSGGM